jgi:hypothetical protein
VQKVKRLPADLTDDSSSGYSTIYHPRIIPTYTLLTPYTTRPEEGTVLYDQERTLSTDVELAPPDLDAILSKKRKWHHRVFNFQLPRYYQMILTGSSIVLSAVQANGVYCWPT